MGNDGWVFIDGSFAGTLGLSALPEPGRVSVLIGCGYSDLIAGRVTVSKTLQSLIGILHW